MLLFYGYVSRNGEVCVFFPPAVGQFIILGADHVNVAMPSAPASAACRLSGGSGLLAK